MTFIGIISNIHALCLTYDWLKWVCKLPGVVIDFVQVFLATVLLQMLFHLVPRIMRMQARFEGIPQKTGVERCLMDRYFLFQVIVRAFVLSLIKWLTKMRQVGFSIVTFSSGIIASLPCLVSNPSGVPSLLAQNMPESSTLFLT